MFSLNRVHREFVDQVALIAIERGLIGEFGQAKLVDESNYVEFFGDAFVRFLVDVEASARLLFVSRAATAEKTQFRSQILQIRIVIFTSGQNILDQVD